MWPLPPPSASLLAAPPGSTVNGRAAAAPVALDAWLDPLPADRRDRGDRAVAAARRWSGGRLRLLLLAAVVGGAALFALCRLLAQQPVLDAAWQAGHDGRLTLATSALPGLQPFQGRALVGIAGRGEPPLTPDALTLQPSSRWLIDDDRRARHRAQQEALVAALARPPVTLWFDAGDAAPQAVEVVPRPRGLARLPAVFWLFSVFGLGLCSVALVVVAGQPSPRNVLYAVMAGAQAGNLPLIAVESTLHLGLPPPFPAIDMPLRMAFDLTTAAAMVHAAALHPRRLAGARRIAAAGWAVAVVVAVVALGAGMVGNRLGGATVAGAWWWCQGGVILLGLAAVGLLGASYRVQPHPVALLLCRITLGAVGTLVLLTAALAAAEQATDLPHNLAGLGSMVWYVFIGSLLLLAPFLVNTHIVAREFSLLAATGTILMSLDLVFVSVFGLGRFASLGLALPISLAMYSGARQWILNRLLGSSRLSAERTFERLYGIARQVEARPERTPVLLADLLRELFKPTELRRVAEPAAQSRVARDGSAMLVPLPGIDIGGDAGPERLAGAVILRFAHRGRRLFTSEDARLSDRIVEQLSRAVAYDRAVEQGRKEERLRLAQDLHDDIGARLLTLMYKAQSPEMEDYVRHTLQDLKTLTRGLAATNHRLSHAAAEWKADLTQRLLAAQIELKWSLVADDDIALSVVQWSGLTRVLRELVSNAIAHAHAERVEIVVALDGDRLELSVGDDGIGRDPSAWSPGLGLGGVRKRVKQLGGEVRWSEGVPRGVCCTVVVPRLAAQR